MKITKSQLKQIIKEELEMVLAEGDQYRDVEGEWLAAGSPEADWEGMAARRGEKGTEAALEKKCKPLRAKVAQLATAEPGQFSADFDQKILNIKKAHSECFGGRL